MDRIGLTNMNTVLLPYDKVKAQYKQMANAF